MHWKLYIILLRWHISSFYWIVFSRFIWFDLIWSVSNSNTMLNCDQSIGNSSSANSRMMAATQHLLNTFTSLRGQKICSPESLNIEKVEDLCWWLRWFIHSSHSFISMGFQHLYICLFLSMLLMQNLEMWIKMVSQIADAISDHLIDNNAWLLLNIILNNKTFSSIAQSQKQQ